MSRPATRNTKDVARLVASGLLVLLLIAFVAVNTDQVEVDFVFANVDAPLIFVLVGTAVVGAAAGALGLHRYGRRP